MNGADALWRDPLLDVAAAAEADRRARDELRRLVLEAVEFGISEPKVSKAAGISRTTLRRWRESSQSSNRDVLERKQR